MVRVGYTVCTGYINIPVATLKQVQKSTDDLSTFKTNLFTFPKGGTVCAAKHRAYETRYVLKCKE